VEDADSPPNNGPLAAAAGSLTMLLTARYARLSMPVHLRISPVRNPHPDDTHFACEARPNSPHIRGRKVTHPVSAYLPILSLLSGCGDKPAFVCFWAGSSHLGRWLSSSNAAVGPRSQWHNGIVDDGRVGAGCFCDRDDHPGDHLPHCLRVPPHHRGPVL